MKKIFIINAGQSFAHSGGKLNQTITNWTLDFLNQNKEFQVQVTNISEPYNLQTEVEKFVWADVIIYHTPIWWFQIPGHFKNYIDEVFTIGHNNGMYSSDGRSRKNPDINYGTGGLLQGKKYMITTTWNAPAAAFTLPGEFFDQKSVDHGILFSFHKMNQFVAMKSLKSFHFHDVEKGATPENMIKFEKDYTAHLTKTFKSL